MPAANHGNHPQVTGDPNGIQHGPVEAFEPYPSTTVQGEVPITPSLHLVPPPDFFPDFAVSPDEMVRRERQLKDYIRTGMRVGEDYGISPGYSKASLFKPGAEKLNAVYGLAPLVHVNQRHEDWDAGFVAYEVKVTLMNKRTGVIEAEGIGSCNSRERRYKNQDAAGAANTVLKMAKKRALVDATISATRTSGMFTQDLEDGDFPNRGDKKAKKNGSRTGSDAPTSSREFQSSRPNTPKAPPATAGPAPQPLHDGPQDPALPAKFGAITSLATVLYHGDHRATVQRYVQETYHKKLNDITNGEAEQIIAALDARVKELPRPGANPGARSH